MENFKKKLQNIMVEKATSIRAIPKSVRDVVEARHKDQYPDGHLEYLDGFRREMWVYERRPKHGGQFIVESNCGMCSMVNFHGKRYYDSLEEIVRAFED